MKSEYTGPQGSEQSSVNPDTAEGVQEFCVDQQAGQRLDQALEALLPHMGIRGRKRCIEKGIVLVNGRSAPASRRMREGDLVTLLEAEAPAQAAANTVPSMPGARPALDSNKNSDAPDPCSLAAALGLRMLTARNGYCFFSKPAYMHSAALAGSSEPSVEALAPALVEQWAALHCGQAACASGASSGLDVSGKSGRAVQSEKLMLLQRLDFGTSGLLCAALTPESAAKFRAAEAEGYSEKRYVALLTGVLSGPVTARQVLNANGRRKTRLREAQADKTRWTDFWPLHVWHPGETDTEDLRALLAHNFSGADASRGADQPSGADCPLASEASSDHNLPLRLPLHLPPQGLTLAACRIRRGARHQIRVHAAGLGHALWGDALYTESEDLLHPDAESSLQQPSMPRFFLHHGGLRLPGTACVDDLSWPLPDDLMSLVRTWFAGVMPAQTHSMS
ncbi:MAG: pseudouridine synthase [Desulfovibrio sp.]|uniref:pseudouridine synthase n=1 Tax=Desulfovibrio sp. TaxID=885 RepID=UPI0039E4FC6D